MNFLRFFLEKKEKKFDPSQWGISLLGKYHNVMEPSKKASDAFVVHHKERESTMQDIIDTLSAKYKVKRVKEKSNLSSAGYVEVEDDEGNSFKVLVKPEKSSGRSRSNSAKETLAFVELQSQLKKNQPIKLLKVGAFEIRNPTEALMPEGGSQTGTKADFIISSDDDNIFISHKDRLDHFPSYSGVSSRFYDKIPYFPEMLQFKRDLNDSVLSSEGIKAFARKIKSNSLKNMSIFGEEFSGDFGLNNVHIVAAGMPEIAKISGGEFELTFSEEIIDNGDIGKFSGDLAPYIFARDSGDGRKPEPTKNPETQEVETYPNLVGWRIMIVPFTEVRTRHSKII